MGTPEENDGYKAGMFYYSKTDKRVFVPKRFGWGWTFNFANPWTYLFIVILIAIIVGIKNFAPH